MFTSVITNKGRILQNKQVQGATIQFTRVVSSAAVVPVVNLREQTGISGIKQTLTVQSIVQSTEESCYTMQVLLENTKLAASYNLSQVGFYAKDPDDGEILFAIAQLDTAKKIEAADVMPGYTLEMNFKFQNANNATVTMEFDPEGFMTREGVEVIVNNAKRDLTILGEASGNIVSITGSANAPFNNITMLGNDEQRTYTGKNVLKNTETDKTINGITFTVNDDGSVTANGTATADAQFIIFNRPELTVGKSYISSGLPSGSAEDTYYMITVLAWDNANHKFLDYGGGVTYKVESEVTAATFNIFIKEGMTVTNLVFKPMIRLASIADDSWEPYTGGYSSPNLDYPQAIKTSGDSGNIGFKIYGKNLLENENGVFESNGVTFTPTEDGGILINGTATDHALYNLIVAYSLPTRFKKGVEYILSGVTDKAPMQIYEWQDKWVQNSLGTTTEKKFVLSDDAKGLMFRLVVNPGISLDNVTVYPMVRVATDEDDTFEVFKEIEVDFPVDAPLHKGDYAELFIDGSGQLVRTRKTVVYDGSSDEPWIFNGSWNKVFCLTVSDAKSVTEHDGVVRTICDKLLASPCGGMANRERVAEDYTIFIAPENRICITIPEVISQTDVSKVRALLQANPITVTYEVEEPIVTELTEAQLKALRSLQTYESSTNLFLDDDICELYVEYFRNNDNGITFAAFKSEIEMLRAMIGDIGSVLDNLIG